MTVFQDLLSNPYAKKTYLVEIAAYDIDGATIETLYFSTLPYVTEPAETPANQFYEPRLNNAMNFQRTMYRPEKIGGRSIPSFGSLILNNTDGGLDYLSDYSFVGRAITIKLGGPEFAYADFGTVFEGTAASIAISKDRVVITLKDLQETLKLPLQGVLYGGTGGTDGGDDLEGKPKPLCYGEAYNISPVLCDSSNLIYQINDGTIQEILAAYDKGARLTPPLNFVATDISFTASTKTIATAGAVDFTTVMDGMTITVSGTVSNNGDYTVASHTATTIVTVEALIDESSGSSFTIVHKAGTNGYTKDLANGRFTLTNNPSGRITADAQGDDSGGGYIYTVADIIRRIVVDQGGLSDPADLDTASFTALNTANSAKVGIFFGAQEVEILNPLDQLAYSIGAFFGFNRVGSFNVGRFEVASGTADLDLSSVEVTGIEAIGTIQPAWRVKIGYKKNFTPQNENDLAGIVATDTPQYDFATNVFRYRSSEDTAVQTKHLLASEMIFDTLMVEEADAATEASRLLTLLKESRRMFRVSAKTQPYNINLNDVVGLTLSRFGMSAGVDFRVIGITENTITNSAVLEVWG